MKVNPKFINWRNIFEANHESYRNVYDAFQKASDVGYPFLAWNGRVYDVNGVFDGFGIGTFEDFGLQKDKLMYPA